jgi:ribose transport system substrate-binding protein
MRATTFALIAAAIGFVMIGCGSGTDNGTTTTGTTPTANNTTTTGGAGGGKMQIAVIPKGTTHDFWKHIHQGADEAAKDAGNVEIVYQGPAVENDKTSQINMVDTMISKGVKGIVLAPLDDKALVASVEKAAAANIPVVVIDSDVNTDKYISFVATDNEKGGHMAGKEMVRLLGGKGRIAVLRYNAGSASTDKREKGFIDEVTTTAHGITIVSKDQYAGPTRESAAKAAENMLAAYAKGDGTANLDGIYCPNESSTAGMLKVLEGKGWAGKVKFVGFDAAPDLVDALNKGEINALVVQYPAKMGRVGVQTVVDFINGKNKSPEKRIDTGAYLITKENVAQPDMAKLVAPAKE